ncbi:MAG: PilX N-terminal domain-containing pilus assembly protein [Methylomonas sp.]
MRLPPYGILKAQAGVVLLAALMFLIMLALLAYNAAQVGVMEERMAGNSHKRDLAFQSAESVLSYVENSVIPNIGATLTQPTTNLPTISQPSPGANTVLIGAGLYQINSCNPNTFNYWSPNGAGDYDCKGVLRQFNWSAAGATLSYAGASYIVERLPNVNTTTQQYRVTAYGVDPNSAAVVIVQAMYAY